MSITQLTGCATWTDWLTGVKSVANILSVLPHIIEDFPDFVMADPLHRASYPPVVDQWSSQQDWEVYLAWQRRDAVMMHLLTSQLSHEVSSVIPMIDDLHSTGALFTVRDMLACLRHHFGLGDYIQANAVMESLRSFMTDMQNIQRYTQRWHMTILALHVENYPIVYIEAVLMFVRNLPEEDQGWFMALHQEVTCEQHDPSKQYPTDSSSSAKSSSQSNQHPSTCPPNCSSSHRANLADSHATVSSNCDGSLVDGDVCTNVAELPDSQCTVNTLNEDEFFICSSAIVISPLAASSTLYFNALAEGALIALPQIVKTLLDSGCKAHIFKEKRFFWSYWEDEAVDVKTANCGVLSTRARGEIRMHVHCTNGKHVVVCLLHAPDVPMNLISIGTLTEWRMFLVFGNNWTSINFPKDHPSLAGVQFLANVLGCLSFLDCEILEPPSVANADSCSIAMPEPFQWTKPSHHTWH
ncbi:hypothetical protein ARMGADRAFT_1090531 [Armillaria gallica]|uniref:Retrovirus-related Pol polyprotein from transposon TNT 1-94-like beta-barrel domain-containing protein n=1 Tax=Armillaria gallica TaxID=47427 RepID=A0A2H3CZX4_ARMGA|nr:hypothetical protein ARMGADRAFT_1090531 [Armillaria gallica]